MRQSWNERIRCLGLCLWGTTEALNRTAVWALVILGILFRLRQYLFDRSLWLDESFLALNIIRRSLADLLKPLDFSQGAPIGFLWLEKVAVHSFGSSEMVLRLVPFIAGIASVALFAVVSRKLLAPGAVPIAVGLFAICHPLIYYSNEAKQYSTDVATVLVLYLIASPLLEAQLGTIRLIVISLTGAAAVWISHPGAFVIAGLALGSLWSSGRRNDRPALLKISLVVATWSCSFLACYSVSLGSLIHNRRLLDYWGGAFAPFPLSSPANAIWYVNSFFGIFSDPGGLTFTGIAAACAVVGATELFAMHQGRFLLLVLPPAFTLFASALQRYPFQGRLLLFLVPSTMLLIAAGLGSIHRKTREALPVLGPLLIGLLFLYPLADAARGFATPYGVEELRSVLEYVEKHRAEGDILYCYHSASPALAYYSSRGLISRVDKVIGVLYQQDAKYYREDLDKLRGRKRVWVLFSHVRPATGVDEELLFVGILDSIGRRMDSSRATGASVYLYDLSTHGN